MGNFEDFGYRLLHDNSFEDYRYYKTYWIKKDRYYNEVKLLRM
jgi:hypothetical protein